MAKQKFPEPTVGALIFNPQGQLFLMKSHKWKDKLVVPGGHIELGETIEESLIREVKEETNLDISNIEFICFQEFIYDDLFWKRRHYLFFDYACKTDSTEVKLNSEAQEYTWVSVEDAFKLPIDSYTEIAIRKYLEMKNNYK